MGIFWYLVRERDSGRWFTVVRQRRRQARTSLVCACVCGNDNDNGGDIVDAWAAPTFRRSAETVRPPPFSFSFVGRPRLLKRRTESSAAQRSKKPFAGAVRLNLPRPRRGRSLESVHPSILLWGDGPVCDRFLSRPRERFQSKSHGEV
jgi:hypothetical protein